MYYEVKQLRKQGLSVRSIGRTLGIDRRTVKSILAMSEEEFSALLNTPKVRNKILNRYEDYVVSRLRNAPLASAAQVHDWLKENKPDLPEVSPKTVYNFVNYVRQKHNIPIVQSVREMMMVEELPYGQQAQVDFGEYFLTTKEGSRKKVRFFVIVLSRSRMKYVYFIDTPFTAKTAIDGHNSAFEYLKGIPHQLVYDQDSVFLVSENKGELILTNEFRAYVESLKLIVHFCRKSDPESKGKIENSVKYVKNNFLYGRIFSSIEVLQEEVEAWLSRTANGTAHSVTRKLPKDEWVIELDYLRPFTPLNSAHGYEPRLVRKDNSICYKGVHYSVPSGTYRSGVVNVLVRTEDQKLIIRATLDDKDARIWKHTIPADPNVRKVINTHHKRDISKKIAELKQEALALFPDKHLAGQFIDKIHKAYPRYIRDQITGITGALAPYSSETIGQAVKECLDSNQCQCSFFVDTLKSIESNKVKPIKTPGKIVPLTSVVKAKATTSPVKRNLNEYDKKFK